MFSSPRGQASAWIHSLPLSSTSRFSSLFKVW